MKQDERRYMVMSVADDAILALLNGKLRIVDLDVPSDVHVNSIYRDYTRRCTCLILESAQFEPVPLGMELPHLPPFTVRN